LEGLASGTATRERWGKLAHDLSHDHSAWVLEAHYLALAPCHLGVHASPKRIAIGGGVMQRTFLFLMIRRELRDLLNNYIPKRALVEELDKFIVPPQLGNHSGVLGAILLAKEKKEDVSRR
jgi:fructokinase